MGGNDRRPLRVATWNVGSTNWSERSGALPAPNLDLLCAQEVTEARFDELLNRSEFDWGVLSLHHDLQLAGHSASERLGVAILGRSEVRLRSSRVLHHLPRPEKFVVASMEVEGWSKPVTVASYHAAPGPSKATSTLAVAHYFELLFGPAILGLDANSPEVDHPDHDHSVFYWRQAPYSRCEPALIGPPGKRRHRMEDAFRRWLADNQSELAEIRRRNPDGPLAVTYDSAKRDQRFNPKRYDSIWVTPEFGVRHVEHLWDGNAGPEGGAPVGGGDHAMVVAELTPRAAVAPRVKGEDVIRHIIREGLVGPEDRLIFNTKLLKTEDRDRVEAHLAEHSSKSYATLDEDGAERLRWRHDTTKRVTMLQLARLVAEQADVTLPGSPPGPHWWIVESTGRTLAETSGDADWDYGD
jgi:hypothetical protein